MSRSIFRLWISLAVGIALLAVALPLSGLLGLRQGSLFPVRWVQVSGPLKRVSAEQVRSSVAPLLDRGLFALSAHQVKAVVEALPWVERAEVRKVWPGTISVRIAERSALARWGDDQLITTEGKHLDISSADALGDMPQLSGPPGRQQELIDFYRGAAPALAGARLCIVAARLSEGGGLTVTLDDGTHVLLGSDALLTRWQRFVKALPDLRAQAQGRNLERVDLRYTHGLAVRWRALETVDVPAVAALPAASGPAL